MRHLGNETWTVDDATVEYLQLRAPATSTEDRQSIIDAMKSGLLFPLLVNTCTRAELLETLLNIPCLIPTIETLLDNLLYLKPCASVMKGLLDTKTRTTVRRSYEAAFRNPSTLLVEEAEGSFRTEHSKADNAFGSSYKQLWLYSMRHFPEMIDVAPKKECGQPNPPRKEPDRWLWYNFAAMAKRLGFETAEINRVLSTNPDAAFARKMLLKARPKSCYCYDEEQFELFTSQILKMFTTAKKRSSPLDRARVIKTRDRVARRRRSGRPYEDSQSLDKHLLFKPNINDRHFLRECEEPTTYFVKRDFIASFFGIDAQDERQPTSENGTNFDDDADGNIESDNSFYDAEEGDKESSP